MELNFSRNVVRSGIPFEQKRQVPHVLQFQCYVC